MWAVDHGADVINMTLLATPATRPSLQAAIDYAWAHDVVVVAATGNDGSSTVTFPAGDRGVIGVSNTDSSDALNAGRPTTARHVPRCARHRHRDHCRGRWDFVDHRHVGLGGRGVRRRGAAAGGRSVRLQRGDRRPSGPQRGCGRDCRSDREWPAEPGACHRGHVDEFGRAGRGGAGGEWRAVRRAVRGRSDQWCRAGSEQDPMRFSVSVSVADDQSCRMGRAGADPAATLLQGPTVGGEPDLIYALDRSFERRQPRTR